jgi:hypothetical protein
MFRELVLPTEHKGVLNPAASLRRLDGAEKLDVFPALMGI